MDYDKKESDRATSYEGRDEGEYMHIIFFAAGTVLTMACFKRIMILLFVEQWRTRVFLLLNLVLLAIVFTSIRSASSTEGKKESNDNVEEIIKVDNKEKKKPNVCSPIFEAGKDPLKLCKSTSQGNKMQQIEKEPQPPKFSKEELNERVEAFISKFRQQLISDARERM